MTYQDIENDWTTVDTDGELSESTVTANWGTDAGGTGYRRGDTGHHKRDFGADYFDDVDIVWDFRFTDVEAGDADSRAILSSLVALSDTDGGIGDDYLRVFASQDTDVDDVYWLRLAQETGNVLDFTDDSGNLNAGTTYYARLRRTGTTIDFDVYSTTALRAAGANGDVAALSDGGSGNTKDYRYGLLLWNNGSGIDPDDHSSGWLTNLDLAYSPGVAIPIVMAHRRMLGVS